MQTFLLVVGVLALAVLAVYVVAKFIQWMESCERIDKHIKEQKNKTQELKKLYTFYFKGSDKYVDVYEGDKVVKMGDDVSVITSDRTISFNKEDVLIHVIIHNANFN